MSKPKELGSLEPLARALGRVIDARDQLTGEHCLMVGRLAGLTATALALDPATCRLIALAGRLHDLGKIAVPDRILRNRDELTERELRIVRAHAEVGEEIIAELVELDGRAAELARIVGAHHERWNGAGYPAGRAGEDIPRGARIVAVADAYSAMVMSRSYDAARPRADVLEALREGRGTHFEPAAVDAFLDIITTEPGPASGSQPADPS